MVKIFECMNSSPEGNKMEIVIVRKCLILLGVLVCFSQNSEAQETCPSDKALENTVAYKGNSASFSRANNGQVVKWEVIPSSSIVNGPLNITDSNGSVFAEFNSVYAANQSALIIFNSTVTPQGSMNSSTAGVYILNYLNPGCITGARLIVIESGPTCSCSDSNPDDLKVRLTCSVTYASYDAQQVNVSMAWKNNSQVVFQEELHATSNKPGLASSVSQYLVDREDGATFECQLTFSAPTGNQLSYVARNQPNFTASCFVQTSEVFIDPTFGPVAGGTIVTITTPSSYENVSITAVYIGNNLQADYYNKSGRNLLVKTPSTNDELLENQPLLIILEISNYSLNISTGKYFTYKPNPRIDDARPRELPLSGGIRLNITGSNLDSVTHPLILSIVCISNGSNFTCNSESFGSCEFPTQNGSQMICLSPPFYIREDFLEQLLNGTSRFSTDQTYTSTNNREELKLNVGMRLDGFDRYKDNIIKDSSGNFDLYYPPTISCEDNLEFNSQEEDTITIQGSDFTSCCRMQDYVIRIGNEICSVKDLTDNALTFNPPKSKPQHTENDRIHCGENFAIFIDLGFKPYVCSCLSYDNDTTKKLIIIVVVTVGSSLILIIFIIVATAVVRRSRKRKRNSPQEPVNNSQSDGGRGTTLEPQELNYISPASDERMSKLYHTDIDKDRSTGEEQWNMNELRRGPYDILISSDGQLVN